MFTFQEVPQKKKLCIFPQTLNHTAPHTHTLNHTAPTHTQLCRTESPALERRAAGEREQETGVATLFLLDAGLPPVAARGTEAAGGGAI